jgi:hypothetical protein
MGAMPRLRRVAISYGDVARSRSYLPLWLGQLLSSFGDTLHYIAVVVLNQSQDETRRVNGVGLTESEAAARPCDGRLAENLEAG